LGGQGGIHSDDRCRVIDIYEGAVDRAKPFTTEYRLRRLDGVYRWILDSGVPWYGPRGVMAGYIDAAVDISDRKRAEETPRDPGGRLLSTRERVRSLGGELVVHASPGRSTRICVGLGLQPMREKRSA
jgi:hypothetical protein